MKNVLQLNADMTPMRIRPWSEAVELLFEEKATTIESVPGKFVRSEHLALPWPSVIALRRYTHVRPRVRFSPRAVILRDGGVCSYCGVRPRRPNGTIDLQALTLDHVIPRAQAKHGAVYLPWSKRWVNVTCWENGTTACRRCNSVKDARTPTQAGMTLRVYPRIPTASDVLRMSLSRYSSIPESWQLYLPDVPHVEAGEEEDAPALSIRRA